MARITSTVDMYFLNATTTRAVAADFFGALSTFGLVQTADTGQTANSAFPAPTLANQALGYQIWRFADTLQSTAPVFFKLELVSSSAATYPGFAITIGIGSDGAGNITGVLLARTLVQTQYFSTASSNYYSGASGRFFFAFAAGNAASVYTMIMAVERSKNPATGADTADGLIVHLPNSTTGAFAYLGGYISFAGANRAFQTVATATHYKGQTTMASGLVIGMVPVTPLTATVPCNPGTNLMFYCNADIPQLNQVTVMVYGANHNYLTLGSATGAMFGDSYMTVDRYAMLFE